MEQIMRVITANVNGIRAAQRKGFFEWLANQNADVVCIQETKAQVEQLVLDDFFPEGYHNYYFDAQKKGYSGTAVYCRQKPDNVSTGLGFSCADDEGRYLQVDFKGLSVVSLYLPSGSSSEERQQEKYAFMDRFLPILSDFKRKRREFIIAGDWNIAHKQIDIKNWRSNQKNSGFLPEERAWMDELLGPVGYVDAFRAVNQEADQYTWWSNRGRARENNVGWRIDYQIVTPGLKDKIVSASVYKDSWFSDHAPLTIDYDI